MTRLPTHSETASARAKGHAPSRKSRDRALADKIERAAKRRKGK